jgi:hypothetical protein
LGKTKYRPFKVTVIKLVDVLQVEPDDILFLILLVVRELAVSKEASNRRLSGFGALALGVDICSNKSTSNNSFFPQYSYNPDYWSNFNSGLVAHHYTRYITFFIPCPAFFCIIKELDELEETAIL